jgi:tetratricopeptide (TPR) repeat protein
MSKPITEKTLLRSIDGNIKQGRRFAFLLGAGASITSGIKGAGELAERWLNEIKEDDFPEYEILTKKNSLDPKNIAASYTDIYQARFSHAPEDGYKEIEDIVSSEDVQPSFGYTVLAQVLAKTRHNVVVTTNFDRLSETALLYYQNCHARVIAHEEMLRVIAVHDQKPSIVKVHRDMHFSPMSEAGEVEKLDIKWNSIIRTLLEQYSFICLGYGGNDNGLMDILKAELKATARSKCYWCHRGEQSKELKLLVNQFPNKVIPVQIAGFDEFMLNLNNRLGYKILSDKIEDIATKRRMLYEKQLNKLTEPDVDSTTKSAVKELVANTWWEVFIKILETKNIEEKDTLFQTGIEKFPESWELVLQYASFLKDIRKDYSRAEKYYKEALKIEPNRSTPNNNYALFMHLIRRDYVQAEVYYKRAIELEPEDGYSNGNYALFLHEILKDHKQSEIYYKKTLNIEPNVVNFEANYAYYLFEMGRFDEGVEYLEKAEAGTGDNEKVVLRLAFLRLALFPKSQQQSRRKIKGFLKKGIVSPGWNFEGIITQAEKQGCVYLNELRGLADKISRIG